MIVNKLKISKDFSLNEFHCKDGSFLVKVDEKLVDKLQQLRDMVEVPLTINSGYRTPEHNKNIGGSPKSQHMGGKAADISILNIPLPIETIAAFAETIGFTGIGMYDTFIHLDVRSIPSKWDLRTKKGSDTMKKGDQGKNVKELQQKLNELEYNCGTPDGVFGAKTDAAVKQFQKENGLKVDGIVGPATQALLNSKKK